MQNLKRERERESKRNFSQILKITLTSLIAALACTGIIYAATTVGNNISTDGTITGSGVNTLYGTTSIGGALTATSTLTVEGLTTLGNASTTMLSVSGNSWLAITTISGVLGMGNNIIQDIGAAGTDFSGTGGLTLADTLTVSSGGINVTGNTTLGNTTLPSLTVTGTLGAEKVINGTFDTDVFWTKGTGWTIDTTNSNVAEMAVGTGSVLSQDISAVAGEEYKITCTVTFTAGNWVVLNLGGTSGVSQIVSGTWTEYITANKTGSLFKIEKSSSTSGTIDNCSVKKVSNGSLTIEGTTTFQGNTTMKNINGSLNITTPSDTGWGGLGLLLEDFPPTDVGWNIVSDRNTYGLFSQEDSVNGGLTQWGISTGTIVPLSLRGAFQLADPTDAIPAVTIEGYKWDEADHVSTLGPAERVIGFNTGHNRMGEFLGDHSFHLNNDLNFMCSTYTENACTVGHGMTTLARTDISGTIGRADDDLGGLKISGYNETGADGALQLRGVLGSTNPTDTIGAVKVIGGKKSGTDIAALGATETVVGFYNNTTRLGGVMGGGSIESILGFDLTGTSGQLVHGVTDMMPEGYAGTLWVESPTNGGIELLGVSEGASFALKMTGILGSSDPVDTISAVSIVAYKQSAGSTVVNLGADETALTIYNGNLENIIMYGDGDTKFLGKIRNTPQAVSCTTGTGVSALTINPTSSYVEITNLEDEGCNVVMGETGAVAGDVVTLCVISTAGGVISFADTADVSELAGAYTPDIDDCITLRYGNTTKWREVGRSVN